MGSATVELSHEHGAEVSAETRDFRGEDAARELIEGVGQIDVRGAFRPSSRTPLSSSN